MNSRTIATYYAVMGAALVVAGIATRGWWAALVGVLLLAAAAVTAFGSGESTSWLRGELDERRQQAADRSFRVAFLVLAWWVAALTVIATMRTFPPPLWAAGIVVALLSAYANYALALRRT